MNAFTQPVSQPKLANRCSSLIALGLSCLMATHPLQADTNPSATWLTETALVEKSATIAQFWQTEVKQQQLVTPDGVTLQLAYAKPAAAKASIVLISGRTESILKYQEMFYDLTQQGYAVFSYDHRGQGLSSRKLSDPQIGHINDFQQYVDDLHLVMQQWQEQFVGQPVALSHSMGGAVLSYYLAQHPNSFKAAAMVAPMHQANATLVFGPSDGCYVASAVSWACPECYAGFSSQPYRATPFENNPYTSSNIRYQRFRDAYQQHPQIQLGGPSWQWLQQACDVAEALPAVAKNIRTPVLIMQAGADSIVTAAAQQQFCQQLGSACEGGRVEVIEGAQHELLIEADQYRLPTLSAIDAFYHKHLQL